MKNRKQNVVAILQKEVMQLEAEEQELKRQLSQIQAVIRDVKQAVSTLQGTVVHLPLSAKVFDTIQGTGRFVSSTVISESIVEQEDFLDIKVVKRDVTSALNRMKKKGAVSVIEKAGIQYYGLMDWVNEKNEPIEKYKAVV
jgi:hypothetical protein